jgi:hypothetical protein
MPWGDEPMLPQPQQDDAPMISGRGTKIIADARGAYLAGNLSALIDRMDEEQRERFRVAIIVHVGVALRLMLRGLGIVDRSAHPVVDYVYAMLDEPTYDNASVALIAVFYPNRFNTPLSEYRPVQVLGGLVVAYAAAIRSETALGAAHNARSIALVASNLFRMKHVEAPYWWANPDSQRAFDTAHRWLVNAAWAILLGRTVTSFSNEDW